MFADRADAGRRLADRLIRWAVLEPVIVAMPRGGVPVAREVADRLGAPLDLIVVRKLGLPWQPELAMGAIAEGGVRVLNEELIRGAGLRPDEVEAVTAREEAELARRVRRYRGDRPALPVEGRSVILIDDGLATGYTARAAIEALRRAGASLVILAVPVAPEGEVTALRPLVDELVVVEMPDAFWAIGDFYQDFSQTSDETVIALLERPGPA